MIKVERKNILSPDRYQESGANDQEKDIFKDECGVEPQFSGTLAEEFCSEFMLEGMDDGFYSAFKSYIQDGEKQTH